MDAPTAAAAKGLETGPASPPQASGLPGPAPHSPARRIGHAPQSPALRARPAARAHRSPSCLQTPRPRGTEPFLQLLGPSQRRKRCLKTQGNDAKTSNLRQAARTFPAAPAPILHGDCQRSRTTQGGARSQRCPRTQALAKERALCTKVTLLFLIMKIAGN